MPSDRGSMATVEELVWRRWNDSEYWIVFHPESRQTHVLDEISASVLRLTLDSPHCVEVVAEQFISEFGIEPEARTDAIAYVASATQRLIESGLIRRPAQ